MIINDQKKSSSNLETEDISQTKRLMKIADEAIFWHTPAGDAFATINENGHNEHLEVSGRAFRDWLSSNFFRQTRSAPSSQTLRDVLGALEGRSRFEGEKHKVFLRVAYADSRLYVDLGTSDWTVVEISGEDWKIISNPPVRFRRAPRMLSLPAPAKCEPAK
jgi:putative DNA primase/helicase